MSFSLISSKPFYLLLDLLHTFLNPVQLLLLLLLGLITLVLLHSLEWPSFLSLLEPWHEPDGLPPSLAGTLDTTCHSNDGSDVVVVCELCLVTKNRARLNRRQGSFQLRLKVFSQMYVVRDQRMLH